MAGKSSYVLRPISDRLGGQVELPGSKSFTNRALICAALADGVSELIQPAVADDSLALAEALSRLGAQVEFLPGLWRIKGGSSALSLQGATINVGPAGTAMRFLAALCALLPGSFVRLQGSARMHERPIGVLVEALRKLGANIEYIGKVGFPPLKIFGRVNQVVGKSVEVDLDGTVSSQFLSAILLVAPLLGQTMSLRVAGKPVSLSYLDMTAAVQEAFGVKLLRQGDSIFQINSETHYRPSRYQIEGDASGAGYYWGVGALSGQPVRVYGLSPASVQGDLQLPAILEAMGCQVKCDHDYQGSYIEVMGPEHLKGVKADLTNIPDSAQTLAVLAACAQGVSIFTGLQTLRLKECDRITAVVTELNRLGIDAESGSDWLRVYGGAPGFAQVETYDDHRMAMAFAQLGARKPGIEITQPDLVRKSLPEFWKLLQELGVEII